MSEASRQQDSNVSTLLAISMPLAEDQENQSSRIQSYTIAQEPFILSDAFSTLEGRKSDPNPAMFEGILEWSVKRHDIEELEWLEKGNVLDLRDRHGDLAALIVDTEGAMKFVSSKNTALLPNYCEYSDAYIILEQALYNDVLLGRSTFNSYLALW